MEAFEIIYSAFGKRGFDSRTHREVEVDDEITEQLRDPDVRRRLFGEDNSAGDAENGGG